MGERFWIVSGALWAVKCYGCAMGTHLLKETWQLPVERLETYEVAVRYQMVYGARARDGGAALATIRFEMAERLAGWLFLAGIVLFSGGFTPGWPPKSSRSCTSCPLVAPAGSWPGCCGCGHRHFSTQCRLEFTADRHLALRNTEDYPPCLRVSDRDELFRILGQSLTGHVQPPFDRAHRRTNRPISSSDCPSTQKATSVSDPTRPAAAVRPVPGSAALAPLAVSSGVSPRRTSRPGFPVRSRRCPRSRTARLIAMRLVTDWIHAGNAPRVSQLRDLLHGACTSTSWQTSWASAWLFNRR